MEKWAVFIGETRISPVYTNRVDAEDYATSMIDFDSDEKIKIEIGDKVYFASPSDLVIDKF